MSLRAAAAIRTSSSCVSMVRVVLEPLAVVVIVQDPVFRGCACGQSRDFLYKFDLDSNAYAE